MDEEGRKGWNCDECVSEISLCEGEGDVNISSVLTELQKLNRKMGKNYEKVSDFDKKLAAANNILSQL